VHLDGTNEKCNTSVRFAFPLSKKSEETLEEEEEEGGKRGARRHNEIKIHQDMVFLSYKTKCRM